MDLSKLSDQELDDILGNAPEPSKEGGPDLSAIPDEDLDMLISGAAPRSAAEKGFEKAEEKDYSELGAGAMGAIQGITFGGADEIGGAAKTAYDVLSGDASLGQITDQYQKNRDALRTEFRDAEQEWGGAYMAGDLAGSFTTALIPGVGAAGQTLRGAAAIGAASGFLRSEADEVFEQIQDSLVGGVAGGVFASAGKGISRVMSRGGARATKFGQGLQANNKQKVLLESMGAPAQTPQQLSHFLKAKGLGSLRTIEEVADEIGLSGAKVISDPRQVSSLVQRNLNYYGSQMDEVINNLDLAAGPAANPTMLLRSVRNSPKIRDLIDSPLGAESNIANEVMDDLLAPVSDGQMWTAREVWGFKKRVANMARQFTNSQQDGIRKQVYQEVDNSLKGILDDYISTTYGANKEATAIFRNASNKYHTLKKMGNLIDENMEIQASGPLGGVRKALNNYSGFIQPTNVASGIAFGPLGYATSLILTQTAKMPQVQNLMGGGLIKAGKFAMRNQNYAKTLIRHAGFGQGAFETTLAAGEAMFDFSSTKLGRSSEEVKQNAGKVLSMVQYYNPQAADQLREAIENDDDELIAGIMSGLSMSSTASQFVQEGIGWDGKAISDGDMITVKQMIDKAPISSVKKAKLKQQFQLDRKVPQIEEDRPFYKVYDPRLKTKRMM